MSSRAQFRTYLGNIPPKVDGGSSTVIAVTHRSSRPLFKQGLPIAPEDISRNGRPQGIFKPPQFKKK